MKKCKYCGAENASDAWACEACGCSLTDSADAGSTGLQGSMGGVRYRGENKENPSGKTGASTAVVHGGAGLIGEMGGVRYRGENKENPFGKTGTSTTVVRKGTGLIGEMGGVRYDSKESETRAIAISVLFGDTSYYACVDAKKQFRIGEGSGCDLSIPELGYQLLISETGERHRIEVSNGEKKRSIDAQLDESNVIDHERRIAVYLSKGGGKATSVRIPDESEVNVGKSEKTSKDGRRNQIVLNFPFVSHYHFRIKRSGAVMRAVDLNSTNGLFLNGKRIREATLKEGDVLSVFTLRFVVHGDRLLIENAGSRLTQHKIVGVDLRKEAPLSPVSERDLHFGRAPRLVLGVESECVSLEKPPTAGGKPQINWLSVLITPMISIGLMVMLVFVMGMNAVMLIMSGVMSAVSAVVAIVTYRKQKKQHGETNEKIDEKYHAYLNGVARYLEDSHQQQLQSLLSANPSPAECSGILESRDRRLWERRPNDQDFLAARLGMGSIPAAVTANFQQAVVVLEENKLETEAEELANNSKMLPNAPILCNLMEGKHTGVVGNRADAVQITRNVITELAAAHSYDELKIVALVPETEREDWAWLRWLPHCADNQRTRRYVFTTAEEEESALDEIEEILGRRKADSGEYHTVDPVSQLPHYLFIVAAFSRIEKHPVRKYIFSEANLGCSSLFLYNKLNALPKECNQIIEVADGKGQMYNRMSSSYKVFFQMDAFSLAEAERFARSMAPLFTETEQSAASIPTSISFLEGYRVSRPEQLKLAERWKQAKTFRTLSVPIAASAGGDLFEFDIHEKRHGVNGIVAGMPGSGKTEMVQSWLLSLAVNYSPQDVAFVLIDFKGTGMIAPFRNLPHLAGSISNLDTNIDRNLTAIQSEVHRREAILDKYSGQSIKNVNDLNKQFAQGTVPERLPILLIVIDEFAEFKKTFPDFGAEIDSLTSKGRALGIFVILMTQKPAGVVSSKSEDNIKFRWCLRVANYGASREMLGRPDAAKISNPGRAFVKVGEDDVFEEVQSFWSGAPYDPGRSEKAAAFTPISRVELDGRRIACEQVERKKTDGSREAEIDVVVRYIAGYCKANRIPDADKVWTDRLPERMALTDIMKPFFNGKTWPDTEKTAPVIGMIDEPANQRQYPMELDFAKRGHTLVYGAPVTGKTTLLQTLILSIALTRRPDEVSIYVMDFGGWNMSVLRDLPHLGGIANDNEPERLKKLVLLLSDLLLERKEKFSKAGVGNIGSYRDATEERIPDVFLIVDNFGAMIKMYPELDSFFITLTGSGANYGIYLIATATATNVVPMKISQNIKNTLALQMIDKSDYTGIVGKVSGVLPAILGRGYAKGNPPLEFQTALPAPGEDDKTVSDNVRRLAAVMQSVWKGELPAMIPEMPETIPYGSVKAKGIVLGLSTDKVQPMTYDYAKQHYLLISGTEQSGKTNLLQVVARQMKEKLGGVLYMFSIKGEPMAEMEGVVDQLLSDAKEIDAFVEGLRPELQRRHAARQKDPDAHFEPMILAVDDFTLFFKEISNDTAQRLLAVVKIGKGLDLYLIAASDATEISGFFNKGQALATALGKAKQAVMLGGCMNDHGAIPADKVNYSEKTVPVREHEGFCIRASEYTVFKPMEIKGGTK